MFHLTLFIAFTNRPYLRALIQNHDLQGCADHYCSLQSVVTRMPKVGYGIQSRPLIQGLKTLWSFMFPRQIAYLCSRSLDSSASPELYCFLMSIRTMTVSSAIV